MRAELLLRARVGRAGAGAFPQEAPGSAAEGRGGTGSAPSLVYNGFAVLIGPGRNVTRTQTISPVLGHTADFVLLRQKDGKHRAGCAAFGAASYPNRAAVLLHNAARNPQAEAGSCVLLCGVEGLENATEIFARDAAAIVGDGDADSLLAVGAAVSGGDADVQRASVGHGIERIHDKVCQ